MLNKIHPQDKHKPVEDLVINPTKDRRLMSHVPDVTRDRTNIDRRGQKSIREFGDDIINVLNKVQQAGRRYETDSMVEVRCTAPGKETRIMECRAINLSATGMLMKVGNVKYEEWIKAARRVYLSFEIMPGTMPEGYEMAVEDLRAHYVRSYAEGGKVYLSVEFDETLSQYAVRSRNRYSVFMSGILCAFVIGFLLLLASQGAMFMRFNKWLYFFGIAGIIYLLSRYVFGVLYRATPIDAAYTPGVTVIIPCFNEEKWIERCVLSCANQDYPVEKLEVIIVDDGSTDRTAEIVEELLDRIHREGEVNYLTRGRIRLIRQEENLGKREALARGIREAKHGLVAFVDSDSFPEPFAIRSLVQPFRDERMGGVTGRADVANTYTNALTQMQSVRYYIAFRVFKAAESYFDAVTCLSGTLACYRRELVIEYMDRWLGQKFLGRRATFGDDRSLTRYVLKHHRTSYQDTAVCATVVPKNARDFRKQQMRWKRSWIRESIPAALYMWRKEPLMALMFYCGLTVSLTAPLIIAYYFLYLPVVYQTWPAMFFLAVLLLAVLMSMAQVMLRGSTTWVYGLMFFAYYEIALIWQIPYACLTFAKTSWDTRMTAADKRRRGGKKAKENEHGEDAV